MHIKNSDLKIIADALRDDKFSPKTQWLIVAAVSAFAAIAWIALLV